jgi:hypothetical protein
MAVVLLAGCVGMLVVGSMFFFAAPIGCSVVAVGVASIVVVTLWREGGGGAPASEHGMRF